MALRSGHTDLTVRCFSRQAADVDHNRPIKHKCFVILVSGSVGEYFLNKKEFLGIV